MAKQSRKKVNNGVVKTSKKASAMSPEDVIQNGNLTLAMMDDSPFFTENPTREFPCFDRTELGLGQILGVGAFCNVHEVLEMRLKKYEEPTPTPPTKRPSSSSSSSATATATAAGEAASETAHRTSVRNETTGGGGGRGGDDGDEEDSDDDEDHYDMNPNVAREYMSDQCIRDGDARYAVKRLRSDLSEIERAKGMVDLAVECHFLSSICHPNIIKMRGKAGGDPLGLNFLILMDRLYDTLEERIDKWKERRNMASAGCLGCWKVDKEEINILMVERLTAAYDIASVFRYLHGHKLVYRDIKPDNMGFDVRGDIKVFDFGLCTELTPNLKTKGGLYNLTGLTGSRRYMAPEVVLCQPYNHTVDVFSYSILLWQMLSCDVPFDTFDPRDHTQQVVKGGYRPYVDSSWPAMAKGLMKECWSSEIGDRPDFRRIADVLQGELKQMTSDASVTDRTMHMLRRSMHSFRLNTRGMGS